MRLSDCWRTGRVRRGRAVVWTALARLGARSQPADVVEPSFKLRALFTLYTHVDPPPLTTDNCLSSVWQWTLTYGAQYRDWDCMHHVVVIYSLVCTAHAIVPIINPTEVCLRCTALLVRFLPASTRRWFSVQTSWGTGAHRIMESISSALFLQL